MKWIFLALIIFAAWFYQQPTTQKFLTFALEKQKAVSYQLNKSPQIRALAQNTKNEITFLIPKLDELRESGFKNKPILNLKEFNQITNIQKTYTEKLNRLKNQLSDVNENKNSTIKAEINRLVASFDNDIKNIIGNKKFSVFQEWRSNISNQLNDNKSLK